MNILKIENKINLKLKSTYIEDSDTTQSTPNYAIHSRQRDKYIWRDIFDIGVSDENGNKIDFTFKFFSVIFEENLSPGLLAKSFVGLSNIFANCKIV